MYLAFRGAPLQITQLLRRRRPVVPCILVTSSSRRVARGDEVIASAAAAFLQSLLTEQPRSPAELRTERMLSPSDFKAQDDIPRARLSPGPRHHNRRFDYLLCHIIFHRRQSCQRNGHPREKFIGIDCYCIWRCRKRFYRAGKKTLVRDGKSSF